jgi:hypothetical protein
MKSVENNAAKRHFFVLSLTHSFRRTQTQQAIGNPFVARKPIFYKLLKIMMIIKNAREK